MEKVIFTICSNNYLAQAKTLGDSVLEHAPDYTFIIILCDKKHNDIDYSFFEPYSIIQADTIGIEEFSSMIQKYDIIELNTAIKPFAFDYLYKTYTTITTIIYMDPDTCLFSGINSLEKELEACSILLTPHIYTPIEFDGKNPTENTFTQYGIYNLGFLGTRREDSTDKMLLWWKKRLAENCWNRAEEGIFVDQLPMNYAPIFFKNVLISANQGVNVAPWNIQEREFSIVNKQYTINKKYPLMLYHFSNYNPFTPDLLSSAYTRNSFNSNAHLKELYGEYLEKIINNKYVTLREIPCIYGNIPKKRKSILSKIWKFIKSGPSFLY